MATYIENLLEEFKDDPQFKAESYLLDLTEQICIIHLKTG